MENETKKSRYLPDDLVEDARRISNDMDGYILTETLILFRSVKNDMAKVEALKLMLELRDRNIC